MGKWGVVMEQHPLTIPARRLPPPNLNYRNNANKMEVIKANNGAWNMAAKQVIALRLLRLYSSSSYSLLITDLLASLAVVETYCNHQLVSLYV
jgi:hypothetical protein